MNKIEHLRLIQEVVSRLSGYSNTIKSWTVSLITITITLGFSIDSGNQVKVALTLALAIAILFMMLDLYYYMLEKSYRNLFDKVRSFREDEIDFRMSFKDEDIKSEAKYHGLKVSPLIGFKSPSIILLYVPILIGGLLAIICVR